MSVSQKLLAIGSRGFVGGHLRDAARAWFDVLPDDGLDITRSAQIDQHIAAVRPDVVVLLAAISDIDRCEQQPELAWRVNTQGAINVARACERSGGRLIFASTGAVFDGLKQGYREEDVPAPLSVYGDTKARAEAEVMRILPDAVIVRIPLVIGFAQRSGTNSLADKLLAEFRAYRPVAAPVDEFRNPIDTAMLSKILLDIAREPALAGIFHAGASDCISRYELACRIARQTGHSPDLVVRGESGVPGRAPRGRHHFLIADKAADVCGMAMPSVDEAIERMLRVPA
jgi:dTDP-4-dehydrorhamnose reductase